MTNQLPILASRRSFLTQASTLIGGAIASGGILSQPVFAALTPSRKVHVNGHLWIYASKFPYPFDSSPVIETAFADMSAGGLDGIELMNMNLRHDDSVAKLNKLIKKYSLPVSGCSYVAPMWDINQYKKNLDDAIFIIKRLHQVGGKTLGISVGETSHRKTEDELDTQASLLKRVIHLCEEHGIQANIHNHTYEIANDMHDLKGTLARIPDLPLGPDINWMIRGGVDPVKFINTYGKNIRYLHIRDQYANGDWTEYLGQGVTDFPAIAQALKAQGFQGNHVAIELAMPKDFTPVNSYQEDWRLSRAYVKKVFGW
jgi:sugar phosphate isomerase/epimerase